MLVDRFIAFFPLRIILRLEVVLLHLDPLVAIKVVVHLEGLLPLVVLLYEHYVVVEGAGVEGSHHPFQLLFEEAPDGLEVASDHHLVVFEGESVTQLLRVVDLHQLLLSLLLFCLPEVTILGFLDDHGVRHISLENILEPKVAPDNIEVGEDKKFRVVNLFLLLTVVQHSGLEEIFFELFLLVLSVHSLLAEFVPTLNADFLNYFLQYVSLHRCVHLDLEVGVVHGSLIRLEL